MRLNQSQQILFMYLLILMTYSTVFWMYGWEGPTRFWLVSAYWAMMMAFFFVWWCMVEYSQDRLDEVILLNVIYTAVLGSVILYILAAELSSMYPVAFSMMYNFSIMVNYLIWWFDYYQKNANPAEGEGLDLNNFDFAEFVGSVAAGGGYKNAV
jgi:hypothetical protein